MFFNSVYVDVKYNYISLGLMLGPCACVVCVVMSCHVMSCPLSVCEVVFVPYVDAVVVVTVMRVVLFLLDVCMLRQCESARLTEMLVWGTREVHKEK